jgi:S-adenosylmethionine:tRNA ribosyltransferase-isomerase
MKTEQLDYRLPPRLIAQKPARTRSSSRLLVFGRANARLIDSRFGSIGEFLRPGDCLVLNDTKVLPARFFTARRESSGLLEGLFLAETAAGLWDVMLKGSRKIKPGGRLYLRDKQKQNFCTATLLEKKADGICRLKIDSQADCETILSRIGFPPLPPYIKRDDDLRTAEMDGRRYQTIYARRIGAVAAPTAGLHFTNKLLKQLKEAGICFAYITLHIGIGTFKLITAENLRDHRMHQEQFEITEENARIINETRWRRGGRIIAVGTTATRVLETVAAGLVVAPARGETGLFITPGYKFKIVDALITNFHLPKSTLLALVAAFAGLENILAAYNHAVRQRYRFYSYGDAMLIL